MICGNICVQLVHIVSDTSVDFDSGRHFIYGWIDAVVGFCLVESEVGGEMITYITEACPCSIE